MTIGGLFEGIGGFPLAASWAGITPVWSNEIDPFCCKVLKKNFTHEIIQADIREIGKGRKQELEPVDIISGGFPCQPFSSAGQRKGKADDRYLWPEMLRIISEVRPSWVVGENVAGILSMDSGAVFEQICTSLEDEGYTIEAFVIPACATGAPHRRDRIWIVGHTESSREAEKREVFRKKQGGEKGADTIGINGVITNAEHEQQYGGVGRDGRRAEFANGNSTHSDTSSKRLQEPKRHRPLTEGSRPPRPITEQDCNAGWGEHWLQAATRLCGVHDGLPGGMDRTKRLKALGNAIVPQVAYEILKAIKAQTVSTLG